LYIVEPEGNEPSVDRANVLRLVILLAFDPAQGQAYQHCPNLKIRNKNVMNHTSTSFIFISAEGYLIVLPVKYKLMVIKKHFSEVGCEDQNQ
jgi:hypothetical protein